MGAFPDNVLPLTAGAATDGSTDTTTTDGSTDTTTDGSSNTGTTTGSDTTTDGSSNAGTTSGSGSSSNSGPKAAAQQHDQNEEEFNSNSGSNTQITKHKPAATQECPSGYGTANVFKNKFQSETCISCSQILSEASGKDYDIFVAHQLCPNLDMQGNFVVIIIIFIVLVIIGIAGGSVLGMKSVPPSEYKEQNMDTQKATTTNQNASVQEDPKNIQDTEKGDIELKKKTDATEQPADTGRAVDTDRPMVTDVTKDDAV